MSTLSIAAQVASSANPVRDVHPSVGSVHSDASRFSDLLSAGNSGPSAVTAPTGNAGAQTAAPRVERVQSIGDAVLGKLSEIGDNYRATVLDVTSTFSKPGKKISLSDMLRIQMSMAQVTLNAELISNSVAKAAQHIDTLTKMQ